MKNIIINNGVTLGVLTIVVSLVVYLIDPALLASFTVSVISIVLYVFFMWKSAGMYKSMNEGYLSFGEGLKASWFTALLAGVIGTIFTYLLYNYIDPSIKELMLQKSIEAVEKLSEMIDEDAYDKMISEIEGQDSFSLSNLATSYLTMSVLGLFTSMIIALIAKKDKSEFA